MTYPTLILLAGPNGAGKSSTAEALIPELFNSERYVDPDRIARISGLSTLKAGRVALKACADFISNNKTFARETTLAGREPIKLVAAAKQAGYKIDLVYMCADNRELLKARVAARVQLGGHDIPQAAQERRYDKSLNNAVSVIDMVDRVILIDNAAKYRRLLWDSARTTQPDDGTPRPKWMTRLNIAKVARLTKRPQFLFVRNGKSERRRSLVIQARQHQSAGTAIGEGFTATKKVGNAVIRNRAKRRLRAASAQLLPRFGLPNADYVFIARRDTATIGWQRLLDDMESALISLANTFKAADDPQNRTAS